MNATQHVRKLTTLIQREIDIAQHLTELTRTSVAAQTFMRRYQEGVLQDSAMYELSQELFRLVRLQLGFCVTRNVLPALAKFSGCDNELELIQSMYPKRGNPEYGPVECLKLYSELLQIDEHFFAKALAHMLMRSKLGQDFLIDDPHAVIPDEELKRAKALIKFNSLSIDHNASADQCCTFSHSEDQTGFIFLLHAVCGEELSMTDIQNCLSGCESQNAYVSELSSLTLRGVTIRSLRGGKTKYVVPREMARIIEERVSPFLDEFKPYWLI